MAIYSSALRPSNSRSALPVDARPNSLKALAWHPDGKRIVTGYSDGILQFWDAQTLQPIGNSLKEHSDWINGLAWCGRDTLATASDDKTVRLWRMQPSETKAQGMDAYQSPRPASDTAPEKR